MRRGDVAQVRGDLVRTADVAGRRRGQIIAPCSAGAAPPPAAAPGGVRARNRNRPEAGWFPAGSAGNRHRRDGRGVRRGRRRRG